MNFSFILLYESEGGRLKCETARHNDFTGGSVLSNRFLIQGRKGICFFHIKHKFNGKNYNNNIKPLRKPSCTGSQLSYCQKNPRGYVTQCYLILIPLFPCLSHDRLIDFSKYVLHWGRSSASPFNIQPPIVSLRPSNSGILLFLISPITPLLPSFLRYRISEGSPSSRCDL